jgi:multidrug efflux pump subunit AcrA (membrane-fusion protein)
LLICAGGAAVLIVIAFLPSSYDPAGPFEILPSRGSDVIARTEGAVADVLVREGDWVDAGQVVAHLSSSDQARDVALRREEIVHAEARLTHLTESALRTNQEMVADGRGEVDRLRYGLEQDEAQLQRATVRAPIAGFVATPNPQFLTGTWLNDGDKLLQINDNRTVEAEIKIPQDDMCGCGRGRKRSKRS